MPVESESISHLKALYQTAYNFFFYLFGDKEQAVQLLDTLYKRFRFRHSQLSKIEIIREAFKIGLEKERMDKGHQDQRLHRLKAISNRFSAIPSNLLSERLLSLPFLERAALLLHDLVGLEDHEIEQCVNKSPKWIRLRLHHARMNLVDMGDSCQPVSS